MAGPDVAQETLNALRDELDTTPSLAIWTVNGPALVRWAQTPYLGHPMRLGTVFPLLTSAPGRIFAAFLDEKQTRPLITAELKDPKGWAAAAGLRTAADARRLVAEVRGEGLAAMRSVVAPGVDVVCAPVFDYSDTIVAAIAVVGLHGQGFDLQPSGRFARSVKEACRHLSRRLGASPEAGQAVPPAVTGKKGS